MKILLIPIITAAADLFTKKKVREKFRNGEKRHIKGRLYIWHVKNKGIAYNRLQDNRKKVMAVSGGACAAVAAWLFYLMRSGAGFFQKLGAALILGGGMGNLIDRIQNREVTDFIYIDFKKAPIFNVADIAAVLGGIVTVISSLGK